MLHIHLPIRPDFDLLRLLAEAWDQACGEGLLMIPPPIGEGYGREWVFPGGLKVFRFDLRLTQPVVIQTESTKDVGLHLLLFNMLGSGMTSRVGE